ncbi:RloB domain-containing protein [Clostridium sp. DL1XJH146]
MGLYRKTYLCVCEGQQEELYLKHVASLLKQYPQRVVTINTMIGGAYKLKKTYTEYDNAALFDYDFNNVEFEKNIGICDQLKNSNKSTKRKNGKKVFHAYSNVNFDLWLILHKEDYNRIVSQNHAYISDVRRIYKLSAIEDIKKKNVIDKILAQITLDDVKKAIIRADKIRERKLETDKMIVASSTCYSNPDFSIHQFLKFVLKDCKEL